MTGRASKSPHNTRPRPKAAANSATPRPSSPQTPHSSFEKAVSQLRHSPGAFPNVSPRWLAGAAAVALLAAAALAWLTLCLLYWQGSWQLLYHPKAAIERTPAVAGLTFEPIRFAVAETGAPQLSGWWLPVPDARFTVLYLHGADGNLGDAVESIAALHRQRLSVFALDYRGYGQSLPAKPSEQRLLQDAESALAWLTVTRDTPAGKILVYGNGLGANLAAELASEPPTAHSPLAGAILEEPSTHLMDPLFQDPRSRLVPARWLLQDRYDLFESVRKFALPSLWLLPQSSHRQAQPNSQIDAYSRATGRKQAAWLNQPPTADPNFPATLQRWLDEL